MDTSSFDSLHELPVYRRRADILASVDANQVTIVTAETGAGKSTQVPQFLAEHGYRRVIVTQPRILAARNLCARVRQEYSWRMGKDCTDQVGYRTAHERDDGPDNVILYCTDGLQLVRELTGSGTTERQVLVLDEIHEWNENMEVLLAWAKKRCREDPGFRVVLMSATIESQSLADYFGSPPAISVEGRSYRVDKRLGTDVISEINRLLGTQTSNMLVFLPGKAEIEAVADAIGGKAADKGVPVIPLHSQLEPEVQQLAFGRHPNGKIVLTTNVAQTSITIDDIDVVIDSGLERRSEVRNGVEGLFIAQVSQADCLQRAGRAGRTKEGLYILAPIAGMPCSPLEERPEYGIPEIMRKHIDRLVLRLANIGIDIEDLEFFHSPSRRTIRQAKQTLVNLGAMTRQGEVTATGRSMERFPVESSYARMLVESERYPQAIRVYLAAIIAIQEVGGIVKGGARHTGWRKYTRQTRSDLLAQYDVLLALPTIPEEDFDELGIIAKNVTKAQEVNERLDRDLGLGSPALGPVGDADEEQLLKCIVAGQLHQIWVIEQGGEAVHIGSRQRRDLSSGTVIRHTSLVAGTPFDLQVPTQKGLETLHLVNDLTALDPEWLEDLAPGQFDIRPGKVWFDSHHGTMSRQMLVTFNGRSFETSGTPLLDRSPSNQQLFVATYAAWLHERLEKDRQMLQMINHRRVPQVPLSRVRDNIRPLLQGAVSLLELSKKDRIELSRLGKLSNWLDDHTLAGLDMGRHGGQGGNGNHDKHGGNGGHQRRWHGHGKPQGKRRYERRKRF